MVAASECRANEGEGPGARHDTRLGRAEAEGYGITYQGVFILVRLEN